MRSGERDIGVKMNQTGMNEQREIEVHLFFEKRILWRDNEGVCGCGCG